MTQYSAFLPKLYQIPLIYHSSIFPCATSILVLLLSKQYRPTYDTSLNSNGMVGTLTFSQTPGSLSPVVGKRGSTNLELRYLPQDLSKTSSILFISNWNVGEGGSPDIYQTAGKTRIKIALVQAKVTIRIFRQEI